ncbi:hypothetical protein U0355_09200 [Salimicrobium sp. PL1-032A]|uniref:hypothetical protein n=1 Tax=Salimicrobium sp. PL1-032A TaxID=3095364 RepID=UPI00326108A8
MKAKVIVLAIVSLMIIVGMSIQIIRLIGDGYAIPSAFMIIGMLGFGFYMMTRLKKVYPEMREGIPAEDERSRNVKHRSAGIAYFISLYGWLLLFAFQRFIEKDDLLLLGLAGMGLSFFVALLLTKRQRTGTG